MHPARLCNSVGCEPRTISVGAEPSALPSTLRSPSPVPLACRRDQAVEREMRDREVDEEEDDEDPNRPPMTSFYRTKKKIVGGQHLVLLGCFRRNSATHGLYDGFFITRPVTGTQPKASRAADILEMYEPVTDAVAKRIWDHAYTEAGMPPAEWDALQAQLR